MLVVNKNTKAFTLIELLVTISILAILAVVGMGQYRTSLIKARDSQRKSDLSNVSRALEMYYNDQGKYPESDSYGRIVVESDGSEVSLDWSSSFEVSISGQIIVYMKVLPQDPGSDQEYCYESTAGEYGLFAILENEEDKEYHDSYTCAGDNQYTYGITSSNARLEDYE